MKKILLLLVVLASASITALQAQYLCFDYTVEEDKTDALLKVFTQVSADPAEANKGVETLASFSTKLGFDDSKMDFVNVQYNPDLWESAFADPNPRIERGKGKKGNSIYLSAVDFKPSSETTISKPTLLYTARFKSKSGKGGSIKQKDFRLAYSELDTTTNQAANPMIAYSNYEGKEYPIQTCVAPPSSKRKKEDTDDLISYFAPNPACDVVQLRTHLIESELASETAYFMLYDLKGIIQLEQQTQIKSGEALDWNIRLEGVPQGLYIALLQIGQERYERKLVVMPCKAEQPIPTSTKGSVD